MTAPRRKFSVMASALLAFSSTAMSYARKSSTYRLDRTIVSREQTRLRRLQDVDSYDGLYKTEDWQYHLADAQRKHTRKSCGKGTSETCAPTTSPSASPSAFPTTSVAPSAFPTLSPSQFPSPSPSDQPSPGPTVSPMPSTDPTAYPTQLPSLSPSVFPTTSPSISPTVFPTTSPMPTPILYETERTDGLVTKCVRPPPEDSGVIQEQTLAFQYNLYTVPDAVFSEELAIMEASIHDGLSREFLTCQYDSSGQSFYVIAVHAEPDDSLSDTACVILNDPVPSQDSKCVVVNAELTMTAYFPGSRRILQTGTTDANAEVLTFTGDFLDSSMSNGYYETDEIVQVTFQGFLNAQEQGGRQTPPSSGGGSSVAAITGGNAPVSNVTDNKMALGGAVVGFAAVILVAILYIGDSRRKRQQEAYLEHLEAISVSDLSYNEGRKSREVLGDGKVHLVLDNSDMINSSGEGSTLDFILRDLDASRASRHDFHNCSSATCPVCQNREQNPTFISAPPQGYTFSEWQRSISEIRNSYRSPDTVDL